MTHIFGFEISEEVEQDLRRGENGYGGVENERENRARGPKRPKYRRLYAEGEPILQRPVPDDPNGNRRSFPKDVIPEGRASDSSGGRAFIPLDFWDNTKAWARWFFDADNIKLLQDTPDGYAQRLKKKIGRWAILGSESDITESPLDFGIEPDDLTTETLSLDTSCCSSCGYRWGWEAQHFVRQNHSQPSIYKYESGTTEGDYYEDIVMSRDRFLCKNCDKVLRSMARTAQTWVDKGKTSMYGLWQHQSGLWSQMYHPSDDIERPFWYPHQLFVESPYFVLWFFFVVPEARPVLAEAALEAGSINERDYEQKWDGSLEGSPLLLSSTL